LSGDSPLRDLDPGSPNRAQCAAHLGFVGLDLVPSFLRIDDGDEVALLDHIPFLNEEFGETTGHLTLDFDRLNGVNRSGIDHGLGDRADRNLMDVFVVSLASISAASSHQTHSSDTAYPDKHRRNN
jgi:hypothetical protein